MKHDVLILGVRWSDTKVSRKEGARSQASHILPTQGFSKHYALREVCPQGSAGAGRKSIPHEFPHGVGEEKCILWLPYTLAFPKALISELSIEKH